MRSFLVVLALLVCSIVSSIIVSAQPLPNPYDPHGWAQPACRLDPYRVEMICDVSPIPSPAQTYAIGEGVLNVPGHERGYLILLNLDRVVRLVEVEYVIGGGETVYRLIRRLPPLSRESVALHDDPLFQHGPIAFSIVVRFEGIGAAHLVTRPLDLWSDETIVAGVRIEEAR